MEEKIEIILNEEYEQIYIKNPNTKSFTYLLYGYDANVLAKDCILDILNVLGIEYSMVHDNNFSGTTYNKLLSEGYKEI